MSSVDRRDNSASSAPPRPGGAAFFVAAGIFLTRLTGLVRQRVFAHYFGLGVEADAFSAAFRIPNVLQNLFGEGALSASFIPVCLARRTWGRREADRVAGAVLSLLALAMSAIVLAGVLATPLLVGLIAPGFDGGQRALTIQLVRILFPGTGLLVLSAWCLGVLNSHRRFLLSYTAPVMWNVSMIAALAMFGGQTTLPRLAVILAWGSVAGSALQFLVQLPVVMRVAPDLRVALDVAANTRTRVGEIVRNFVPAFVSRGVIQISTYVDTLLASLLPTGAVAGLMNAQLLYTRRSACSACRSRPRSFLNCRWQRRQRHRGTMGADPGAAAILRQPRRPASQIAFFIVPSRWRSSRSGI